MQVVSVLTFMMASVCLASNCAYADWIIFLEDIDRFHAGRGSVSADVELSNGREFSSIQDVWTRIFAWGGDRGGMLILDDFSGNISSALNEAILTVHLPGYTALTLPSFPADLYDSFGEGNGLETWPFVGPIDTEGVSVSSDGTSGSPLINFPQTDLTWGGEKARLSDFFTVPVLDLSETFPIRLQSYDKSFPRRDGRKVEGAVLESAQQLHLPEPEAVTLFGLGLLCLGMSCVRRLE